MKESSTKHCNTMEYDDFLKQQEQGDINENGHPFEIDPSELAKQLKEDNI